MKYFFKKLSCFCCFLTVLTMTACGVSSGIDISINSGSNDSNDSNSIRWNTITITDIDSSSVDKIVPDRESLTENLENAGYTITEYTSVGDSALSIDRIVAEKDSKFIDITYGLTYEDAGNIFDEYYDLYKEDGDYYILALNGNYVYCVSDKKTFSNAGFTSTGNIGIQYIND